MRSNAASTTVIGLMLGTEVDTSHSVTNNLNPGMRHAPKRPRAGYRQDFPG